MKKKVLTLFVLFIIAISLQSFSMIMEAPASSGSGCFGEGSCKITKANGDVIESSGSYYQD